jgi:hypothetical protein
MVYIVVSFVAWLVMGFVVACVMGFVVACVASDKGFWVVGWFVYGVLLWPIAVVHVLVAKPKGKAALRSGNTGTLSRGLRHSFAHSYARWRLVHSKAMPGDPGRAGRV